MLKITYKVSITSVNHGPYKAVVERHWEHKTNKAIKGHMVVWLEVADRCDLVRLKRRAEWEAAMFTLQQNQQENARSEGGNARAEQVREEV